MSVWKLLRAAWGSGADENADVRIDAATSSLVTVDYAHHEVHSGDAFAATHSAAGGAGTKATISFATPDTTKWAHVLVFSTSNVAALLTVGEIATVTAVSGADYAPRNKNRNSGTASTLISAGSAGGAGLVTIGGTVTDFGTILEELQVGAKKVGGDVRGTNEWVLKQDTVYAFEIEAQEASAEVSMVLEWYEHADHN